ncbi:lipid-A-disaccharide synthase [Sneathiella sp. P13V-1]|uniref:lipid-A-disaccharide synthase n=1 Tax=Sneathiella sp. P13V-1 TaxID=2697366 RepID=UPI00187BA265|nr:lipid-A-disaccharide synthase [Sneathiella sp. P13V-1]MBE7637563.1 lipid-A-disaccharide synthase [Sneathiella sp. P13V-1]
MYDPKRLKIFLVAGEPSGDLLASRLMTGLIELFGQENLEFHGVGGPLMEEKGLKSLFPMDELTVMGIAEVLPQLKNLLKRIKHTASHANSVQPDVFITVDAPDFSFRVAKKLKDASFLKVHYVAPSVWAWRPGRAKKIAGLYDHLLTLLPFEPPYFEKEGLAASFVGHSIIESGADKGNRDKFRRAHGIGEDTKLLMMLPGSRKGEVTRHLDIFTDSVRHVMQNVRNLKLVIPVIGKTRPLVTEYFQNTDLEPLLVEAAGEKYDAMAASDAALAASGTVGLELAMAGLPSVIAYRMHPVTSYLARKLVKLDYVNLVNILEEQEVVPEFLLEDCTVENLSPAIKKLLTDNNAVEQQQAGYNSAMSKLQGNGEAPGLQAARIVKELISG